MATLTWNRWRLFTVAILVVLAALVASETYVLGTASPTKNSTAGAPPRGSGNINGTITVSGTGHSDVSPDRGILSLGVVTQATTAQAAVANNSKLMNAVILVLNGLGIGNSDVQTLYYDIYPQTSCCTGPQTITGYQVTNEIQVTIVMSGQTVSQLGSKVGQVIDVAVSNGATQVYGVQFTASATALEQARLTALGQAVQDASQQARVIASSAGVTITGVVSITSVPNYYSPVVYFAAAQPLSQTPVVPPQSLTVIVNVQAVFAIN